MVPCTSTGLQGARIKTSLSRDASYAVNVIALDRAGNPPNGCGPIVSATRPPHRRHVMAACRTRGRHASAANGQCVTPKRRQPPNSNRHGGAGATLNCRLRHLPASPLHLACDWSEMSLNDAQLAWPASRAVSADNGESDDVLSGQMWAWLHMGPGACQTCTAVIEVQAPPPVPPSPPAPVMPERWLPPSVPAPNAVAASPDGGFVAWFARTIEPAASSRK